MLSFKFGSEILDGFLRNTDANQDLNFNISELYLGLLTQAPSEGEELQDAARGIYCYEPKDKDYIRIPIKGYDIRGVMGEVTIDEDTKTVSITNTEYIMFPEAIEDWPPIVAFGIFTKKSSPIYVDSVDTQRGAELPLIWGDIKGVTYVDGEYVVDESSTSIQIDKYDVPVIPKNSFTISLS